MRQPRHTSRGIVIHDGKLLLIERQRDDLHYYSIPGGGIEPGETPEQTVIREIAEETSCTVTLGDLLYIFKTGNRKHYIYQCAYVAGEPHLPADSPEAKENNPNNSFDPTWLALEHVRSKKFFIWRPIIIQLHKDLQNGFAENVVEIAQT